METLSVHWITTAVMIGSAVLLPVMTFFTYTSSGASAKKAGTISAGVAVWAAFMFLVIGYWQSDLGTTTRWVLTLLNLAWPTALVFWFRDFFVGDGLSLKWLTFVQSTRLMGGLFIVENFRDNTGLEFAYASGIGDIAAGVIAVTILVQLLTGGKPNKAVLYFLIAFGVADFVMAYSLSMLSTDGLGIQAFAEDGTHLVNVYPLGILPWLLVPFAMAYHGLMFLTVRQQREHIVDSEVELVNSRR